MNEKETEEEFMNRVRSNNLLLDFRFWFEQERTVEWRELQKLGFHPDGNMLWFSMMLEYCKKEHPDNYEEIYKLMRGENERKNQ